MKVKPAREGAMVRDPHTRRPLPAEGAEVPEDNFWVRRLQDGDVVRVDGDGDTPTGLEPVAPLTTRKGR